MEWHGGNRAADGLCGTMRSPSRRTGRETVASSLTVRADEEKNAGSSRSNTERFSIQAVTFDVGGTLIAVWPSVGHVYAELAARYGNHGLSAALLNRRFAAAWRAARQFGYSRSDWAALVDATFLDLTGQPPSRTFFTELYDHFSTPGAWRIFDDVIPALQALAEGGIKLGVISNWDERLRPLLERFRLAEYFETIVVSSEVRTAKPAAAIFQYAARSLGLPPAAVLHVGDDPAMDVRGARAAGLRGLLLRRDDGPIQPGCISSLRELWQDLGRAAASDSSGQPVSDDNNKSQ
jgi:putative hydrolase of the HAD superfamily